VKKKFSATNKDKKDWSDFTKQIASVFDKDSIFFHKNKKVNKVRKLDLHGFTLDEANRKVKKFIIDSYEKGFKKILVITGKGLRSKVYEDPYRSKKMSVLKYSVPEYLKNDEDLCYKIRNISRANLNEGGNGAIYIYLK